MQPIATPIQMDGYDPAMQAPGIPQGAPAAQQKPPASEEEAWGMLTPEQQMEVPPSKRGQFLSMLMGNYGAEAQDAQQDMSRADALRGDQRATGQNVGPDNIYVGASPLEHMADGMRGYQGMRDFKEAKTARTDARAADATRREGLGDAVMSKSSFLRGLFD